MKNSSYFSKLVITEGPLNNAAHDLYTVLKISQSIVSLFSKANSIYPKLSVLTNLFQPLRKRTLLTCTTRLVIIVLPVVFSNRHDNSTSLFFDSCIQDVIIGVVQRDFRFYIRKQ